MSSITVMIFRTGEKRKMNMQKLYNKGKEKKKWLENEYMKTVGNILWQIYEKKEI